MTDEKPLIRLTNEPGSGHLRVKRCPRCGSNVQADSGKHVACEQGHRLTDDERRDVSDRLLDHLWDRARRRRRDEEGE